MKKYILFLIVLFLAQSAKSQLTDYQASITGTYILNIAKELNWTKAKNDDFIIGVYGNEQHLIKALKEQAKMIDLPGRKIVINQYKTFRDLKSVHLLYISISNNASVPRIFQLTQGHQVVLVTESLEDESTTMINFKSLVKGKRQFSIIKKNLDAEGIALTDKIIALAGDKSDIRDLYGKTEAELKKKENELFKKEQELAQKEIELERQKYENRHQKDENKKQLEKNTQQEQLLIEKQGQIDSQTEILEALQKVLKDREDSLITKDEALAKREAELAKQNERINNQNKLLDEREKEINKRDKTINTKDQQIQGIQTTLETQQGFMLFMGSIILIIAVLLFFIFRSNRQRKIINKKLEAQNTAISQQNTEIQQQKEEIMAQSEQLSITNKELEKLSIVASETQNAVIIMDKTGKFEWINVGFTRMYGYTLQLLKHEKDEYIHRVSKNSNIGEIIKKCVSTKESIVYEALNETRAGEKKWVQTTLTPITDESGNVSKLVAIDSDISSVKEAQEQIRQQSEELMAQRDELSYQNQEIERKNHHIQSGIKYAMTIQQAILPIKENLDRFINSFIIFKPKDIVSGDFYWYTVINSAKEEKCNTIFIAAVDCTGHGVPGAFMSMIGSRLLNEIVNERKIHEPNMILDQLNAGVRNALKQEQTDNNDGMDVSLCKIDNRCEPEVEVTFAGAKRPLIYFEHNSHEIKVIKGDRKTIGGVRIKRNVVQFSNKKIMLKPNDVLYLTSDGLIDQNAPNRKRYGSEKFYQLLDKIGPLELETQKTKILDSLATFQENEEQRDDITIIGIRL